MPKPAILNQVAAYLAKIETTYGTAETLAGASDAMYPYLGDGLPAPPAPLDYLFDGNLGRDPRTLFPTLRVSPNGRGYKMSFPCLFKGAGTSYLAGTKPPKEVDLMLRACGFASAFASATHTYSPVAAGTGYESVTFGAYLQGKAHIITGALGSWSFDFNDLGAPKHTFELQGIGTLPATASLPSATYDYTSVLPPVAAGAVVTMGDWITPDVKGGSFAQNRNLGAARARITAAAGHLGHVPGGMEPELTLMVEQTALASSPFHTSGGLDPDRLREAATAIPVSLKFGTATNNNWIVNLASAQCVGVTPANDDNVAMWELKFRPTSATAVTVVFGA